MVAIESKQILDDTICSEFVKILDDTICAKFVNRLERMIHIYYCDHNYYHLCMTYFKYILVEIIIRQHQPLYAATT